MPRTVSTNLYHVFVLLIAFCFLQPNKTFSCYFDPDNKENVARIIKVNYNSLVGAITSFCLALEFWNDGRSVVSFALDSPMPREPKITNWKLFSIETRLNLVFLFINKLQRKSKPVRLVQTGIRRRGSGFDCDSSLVSASVAFCFLVLDVRQVSSKVILSSFINCTWQHCPL